MASTAISHMIHTRVCPSTLLKFLLVSLSSVPFPMSKDSELPAECLQQKRGATPVHRHLSPPGYLAVTLCCGNPSALGLQDLSFHVFLQITDGVDAEVSNTEPWFLAWIVSGLTF